MRQKTVDISKTYTLEEYITIDETGTQRHEYYYGKLIPMPGESLLHNKVCLKLYRHLHTVFENTALDIYVENVKVKIEGENIYVYPDIVVMKEQPKEDLPKKDYIIYQPLLIAEVLSDSTRKYDLTDKLIQYQKLSTLQYYLAIEPEKQVVIFYEKEESGDWNAKTFTELNEVINLPELNSSISLNDIYKQ